MSTEQKDLIKELSVEMDEHYQRRTGKDETVPFKGGNAALMRHIGQHPAREVKGVLTREGDLEKDGSQFVLISIALLAEWGCPEPAREFVYIMEGIANGNHSEVFPFTDDQINAVCGLSTRTIQEKRKALLDWEEGHDCSIVIVKEKKFNPDKGTNDPTHYQVPFIKDVADFMRSARANSSFRRNPIRAIENADESGLRPLINQAWENLSPKPVERRNRKDLAPPKDDKLELFSKSRISFKRQAQKWSDLAYELGMDVDSEWDQLLSELSVSVSEARGRHEQKARQMLSRKRRWDKKAKKGHWADEQ